MRKLISVRFTADIVKTIRSEVADKIVARVFGMLLATLFTSLSVLAQNGTYPPPKPTPAKIVRQMVIVEDSVVAMQWTHTLNLVNAPQNVMLLNPGQCVRIGIYAAGDNRDAFLEKTKVSFSVQFAGHADTYPLALPYEFKQIKPEGEDFVAGALTAGGIKMPANLQTMASLGVSAAHWCVPANAIDGVAIVNAQVDSPSGHQVLNPSTVRIESFVTGSEKSFKNIDELGAFSQTYYRQPESARLLPATIFAINYQSAQKNHGQFEIFAAFLSAALKSDPIAAQDFRSRLTNQTPLVRAFGLLVLRSAGYDIGSVLDTMSPEQREKFLSLPQLQNPYDLTPTTALFQHLDMLWAVFGATGEFKPVKTVASALSWKSDYEAFESARKAPAHPLSPTPSIVRGITYTAAGWSLKSFQQNDGLVADYIDYLLASPETPQLVKTELKQLWSNPAFNRQ